MLYSTVVNFQAQDDSVIPATRGYHAYAMFLDLLNRANKSVAQKLHDIEGTKPFTVSPLQGKFQRHSDGLKLTAGAIYWMRLTFLQEDSFAHFLDATLKAANQELHLGKAALQIQEVLTAPKSSPLCNCQGFEDILTGALANRQIHLKFLSPTAFRSGGKRNVFFPEPRLLFNGYLAKWQSFSPVKLDNDLLAVAEKATRIAQYKLETRILDFGSYKEIGFEGRCTVEIAEEMPKEAARSLNALADFAFYCGTGAKTTMGMGQTQRIMSARR